jgi:hypothetical protein
MVIIEEVHWSSSPSHMIYPRSLEFYFLMGSKNKMFPHLLHVLNYLFSTEKDVNAQATSHFDTRGLGILRIYSIRGPDFETLSP